MNQANQIAVASNSNASKDEFKALITKLDGALSQHGTVYPTLIATAAQFDKELAAKIQASADADMALFTYLKSKAEQPAPQGIIARIGALLLGR